MTLKLNARTAEGVSVLQMDGRLVLGDSDDLRHSIDALVEQGSRAVVLDLDGVNYVDSAGVGELVRAYTTVTRAGGKLALAGLSKRLNDLLQVTKLISVFPVYDDAQQAIAGLREA